MGAQLSRNKKDGKRHVQPSYPPYPPYPYWPGPPMAVVPPGFPQPSFMPPWPANNHHAYKRRRKRTHKKSGPRGDHGGLPAGFGESPNASLRVHIDVQPASPDWVRIRTPGSRPTTRIYEPRYLPRPTSPLVHPRPQQLSKSDQFPLSSNTHIQRRRIRSRSQY